MHTENPSAESRPWFQKFKVPLIVGALILAASLGIVVVKKLSSGGGSSRKGAEIVSVRLPPPPPTPLPAATPPPAPEMKQEQKMVEQAPVNENEEKPKDEPAPAAPISTGIKGDGAADGFGVGGSGNGQIGGSGSGHLSSKWGWYAGQVNSTIGDALRKNPKTRVANFKIKVRIWADITGRIVRIKAESTNNPTLDSALNEALTGLQLKEPPPQGMPAPIVLRVSAQH